jgi:hypothetical protein
LKCVCSLSIFNVSVAMIYEQLGANVSKLYYGSK